MNQYLSQAMAMMIREDMKTVIQGRVLIILYRCRYRYRYRYRYKYRPLPAFLSLFNCYLLNLKGWKDQRTKKIFQINSKTGSQEFFIKIFIKIGNLTMASFLGQDFIHKCAFNKIYTGKYQIVSYWGKKRNTWEGGEIRNRPDDGQSR